MLYDGGEAWLWVLFEGNKRKSMVLRNCEAKIEVERKERVADF